VRDSHEKREGRSAQNRHVCLTILDELELRFWLQYYGRWRTPIRWIETCRWRVDERGVRDKRAWRESRRGS